MTKGDMSKYRIIIIFLLICILIVSGFLVFQYLTYKKLSAVVLVDNIYENVFVEEVNLGGMTKEDASITLENSFVNKLNNKKLTLKFNDEVYVFTYKDFGIKYNFDKIIEDAYSYGKHGSIKERYNKIVELEKNSHKIDFKPKILYNEDTVRKNIESLADKVYKEPVNAKMSRSNGEFVIHEGENGFKIDVEETFKKVEETIITGNADVIEIETLHIEPQYRSEDFKNAQTLLGSFKTSFSPGTNGRNQNIKNSLEKINNAVVYPNEVFSTNEMFGDMTYENGYRPAPSIINGKLVDDIGGGVCQVSSTLYNAVLYSELEVVERRNHSLKVGYLDYGFDATLAGDYIDLKFKNNTKLPIIVEGYVQNGNQVVVNIYGYESRPANRKLVFVNSLLETVKPQEDLIKEDVSIPKNQKKVITQPRTGYKYSLYKIVYEGDKEVERVLVNTSSYKAIRGEILLGVGPVEQKISPSNVTANNNYPIVSEEFEDIVVEFQEILIDNH